MCQLHTVMLNENWSFQHLSQKYKSEKFKDNCMYHASDNKSDLKAQRLHFDHLPLHIRSRRPCTSSGHGLLANSFSPRFQRHQSYLWRYTFHWWTILSFQVKHFKTEQSEILSDSRRLFLTKISHQEFYRWAKLTTDYKIKLKSTHIK